MAKASTFKRPRGREMTNREALVWLWQKTPFEAASMAGVARELRWPADRTYKAVKGWETSGKIQVERGDDSKKITLHVSELVAEIAREIFEAGEAKKKKKRPGKTNDPDLKIPGPAARKSGRRRSGNPDVTDLEIPVKTPPHVHLEDFSETESRTTAYANIAVGKKAEFPDAETAVAQPETPSPKLEIQPPPIVANASTKETELPPPPPPVAPHSDTISETDPMWFFNRPKAPAEAATMTSDPVNDNAGTDQEASSDRVGEGAAARPSYGYGAPVAVTYGGVPSLRSENPDWKFAPRQPAVEGSAWRPWRRTGRAIGEAKPTTVTVLPPRRQASWSFPLWVLAYALLATSLATGVWNATSSTASWWDAAIPIAISAVSEFMLFFLPGRIWTVGWPRKILGFVMLIGFVLIALMNSMRLASNVSADQAMIRADRQTTGVQVAAKALADARAARDKACRAKQGNSKACADDRADVAKLEKAQTQTAATVTAAAKPENADFARVVAWITYGAIQPSLDDFQVLWLLLRTVIPQLGGLVLVMSRR